MPVVTDITLLSTTAGSNSPAGSESIGTNADDYLRQMHAFIATLRDGSTNIALGTVGAPSIRPTGGATTGIYWPSTSQFAVSISGTQRLLVNSTGISGDGSQLTALNATQLTTGTVPSARVAGAYTAITAIGNTGSHLSFTAAGNATVATPSSGIGLSVNAGLSVGSGGSAPPAMTNVATAALNTLSNIAGGAPQTSGSTDANVGARIGIGSVALDFGVRSGGEIWAQARSQTNYATNFQLQLNPNGGGVLVGGALTMNAAASQLVPGTTSFSLRNNLNSADNVLVSDAGLVTIRDDLRVLGDQVIFSADGTATNEHLVWSRSSTESRLTVSTGGLTDLSIMNLVATDGINATYQVNGTSVVTSRRTGWAAATGTATRTTFATGTVTTTQLAERVKALIDDLITHGLIGA